MEYPDINKILVVPPQLQLPWLPNLDPKPVVKAYIVYSDEEWEKLTNPKEEEKK